MKTSRIACLAVATLSTWGSFAHAESLEHLDDLAVTAERQSRQVLYQTYSLHAYGPAAYQLKENAFDMIRLARHVHEVAHVDHSAAGHSRRQHQPDRITRQAHLAQDVADLDRLMHNMQDLVARMKLRANGHRPAANRYRPAQIGVSVGRHVAINIGRRGSSYHHYHGGSFRAPSSLDRIELSLARLAETVHHLAEDANVVCIRRR